MAKIYIKKREFPIMKPNEVAQKIKDRKYGTNGATKAEPSELIDLGDEWAGTYGDIKAIEMDFKANSNLPELEVETRTPEERNAQVSRITELAMKAGFIKSEAL